GINNFGQIACGAVASDNIFYPAIYDRKTGDITTLGSLGGVTSYGYAGVSEAINNLGQAVGYSYLPSGLQHAFLYDKDGMHDIGLPSESSVAFSVNDSGTVVGESEGLAFCYQHGIGQHISPFESTESEEHAINSSGDVVGDYP